MTPLDLSGARGFGSQKSIPGRKNRPGVELERTVGQRLVNGWSTVGQRLVNGWSTVGQHAKWSNLSVAALILGARSPRTRPRARARAILKNTPPIFHEGKSRTKNRKFVAQMCPMDKSGWGYFQLFWRPGHTHGTPEGGVGGPEMTPR